MEDLSLHILDIVENSIAAEASRVEIRIVEDTETDRLTLDIIDNGKGMDTETKARALDPFFTTKSVRRIGLGLPLLSQSAREAGGKLDLVSEPNGGTVLRAVFQLSHPDRRPLGDLAETLRVILMGKPDLDLAFEHRRDSEVIASLSSRLLQQKDS